MTRVDDLRRRLENGAFHDCAVRVTACGNGDCLVEALCVFYHASVVVSREGAGALLDRSGDGLAEALHREIARRAVPR